MTSVTKYEYISKKKNQYLHHVIFHLRENINSFLHIEFTVSKKIICLVIYAIILFSANISTFFHPYVLGEEGSIYLHYAREMPWNESFLLNHQGYYSLVSNASGILVNTFSLKFAPYILLLISFIIQLLPPIVILQQSENQGLFKSPLNKIIALCILMVGLFDCHEVLLNTINSQFHLTLACTLLLIGVSKRKHRIFNGFLLTISGLTGPGTVMFAPFFWWKFARDISNKENLIQAIIITLIAITQASLIFYESNTPELINSQHNNFFDMNTLLENLNTKISLILLLLNSFDFSLFFMNFFVKTSISPLFLHDITASIFACLKSILHHPLSYGILLIISIPWLIVLISGKIGRMIFSIALFYYFFTFLRVSSMWPDAIYHAGGVGRYEFIPVVLLGIGIYCASIYQKSKLKWLAFSFFTLFFLVGLCSVFTTKNNGKNVVEWSSEVKKWRESNYTYFIEIAPQGYKIQLNHCKEFSYCNSD